MTNYKIFYFNVLRTACTVLWSEDGRCAIADPGCQDANEKKELTDFIAAEGLTPAAILLTHGHPDHICAARWLQDLYGIPVQMNSAGDKKRDGRADCRRNDLPRTDPTQCKIR